jgi:hypothetical protein
MPKRLCILCKDYIYSPYSPSIIVIDYITVGGPPLSVV